MSSKPILIMKKKTSVNDTIEATNQNICCVVNENDKTISCLSCFRIFSTLKKVNKKYNIYMKKKIGTVSFRKFFWLFRDLNQGPNDSDSSSIQTELYISVSRNRLSPGSNP